MTASSRCLVLFTKPARPGRVKTRLVGEVSAEQAAELHAAFVGDVVEALASGEFDLRLAWALDPGDELPAAAGNGGSARPVDLPDDLAASLPAVRQEGADLGERMYRALAAAGRDHAVVGVFGSDHPHLDVGLVEDAFARLEAGADVVLGPAEDGGYYFLGARPEALDPVLFRGVPWSTETVLEETLERCRSLGLAVELLPEGWDVDTPEDLARLARLLAAPGTPAGRCPRTRVLLSRWERLP